MDNPLYSLSDLELWQQFKSGSEDAYAFMYEKFVPVLYSYGYRIYPNEDVVKDCLQDLFVNLWLSRQNLSTTDSIRYYLFRSLRREIAQKVNANLHFTNEITTPFAGNIEDSSETLLIELEERHTQRKELDEALTYLSDRQREAIYLRFYQNISFEEVASIMGITQRAAYKLIYRAVDTLKKIYMPKSSPPSSLPVFLLMHITLIVF